MSNLQSISSLQFRNIVDAKLCEISFANIDEIDEVIKQIGACFFPCRFAEMSIEKFQSATNRAFDHCSDKLSQNTLQSIYRIFHWIAQIYSITDLSMCAEPSLRSLNLELTDHICLYGYELSQLTERQKLQFISRPQARGEILAGARAAKALGEVVTGDLSSKEHLDFSLHQEMLYLGLRGLRDYSLAINADEVLLRVLFEFDHGLYQKYRTLFLESPQACEAAIAANQLHFFSFDNLFKSNQRVCLAGVRQDSSIFSSLTPRLRADVEIARMAVTMDASQLQFASEELRRSPEFIHLALESDPDSATWLVDLVGQNLIGDPTLVRVAVCRSPLIFASIDLRFRGDRDIASAAVEQVAPLFQFASSELRDNREFVLEAVKRSGRILKWASLRMQSDRAVILEALKDYSVLYDSAEILNNSQHFMRVAIEKRKINVSRIGSVLLSNRRFLIEILTENPRCLTFLPIALRGDPELALIAIRQDPEAQSDIDVRLYSDKEFILEWLRFSEDAYELASDELRRDPDVLAARDDFASRELQRNADLLAAAQEYRFASEKLQRDQDANATTEKENSFFTFLKKLGYVVRLPWIGLLAVGRAFLNFWSNGIRYLLRLS